MLNGPDSSAILALVAMLAVAVACGYGIARTEKGRKPRWNLSFLIVPGYGMDAYGAERFIAGHELMRLYGVHPNNCVVFDERFPFSKDVQAYVPLRARIDGNYDLQQAVIDAHVEIPVGIVLDEVYA